jgi:hypothetical protein
MISDKNKSSLSFHSSDSSVKQFYLNLPEDMVEDNPLGGDFVSMHTNTQISKTFFLLCEGFSPLQPSFVYLLCPKTGFVGEYTDTHYKMTKFLFVYYM